MNYLRHMDRSQVAFDSFCYATSDETYCEEIEALDECCYIIDIGNHTGRIRLPLGQVLEQYAGQYPVAYLHGLILSRFLYPATRRHGVWSFVVHSHATVYFGPRLRSPRNWLVCRNIGAYPDTRLVCSRAAGDSLFGPGRFEVVPNAISVETHRFNESARAEVRSRLGLGGAPVVSHVGRFSEQKNHRFLIDVCTELFYARPDAHLMLIGDGPLRPGIKAAAAERGLNDCVLFLGDCKDVPDLYQAVDMFLLPSLYEGLPMVGVEVQCAGLPLVCSDEVTDKVMTGEVSLLPSDMSAPQRAHHVSQVLDHGRDPRHRVKGERATCVTGFGITYGAERLAHCYRVLVER